jgi:hypothetical protein
MKEPTEYRVIARSKFAAAMVIPLGLVAVGVWAGLDFAAQYMDRVAELVEAEPQRAAATLTQLVRLLAVANGLVLFSLATLIIWHGRKGWRTAAMPPKGSWVLEGQRVWQGEAALRIARFTMIVGVMLAVLAVVSSLVLWGVGDTLADWDQPASESAVSQSATRSSAVWARSVDAGTAKLEVTRGLSLRF